MSSLLKIMMLKHIIWNEKYIIIVRIKKKNWNSALVHLCWHGIYQWLWRV